MTCRNCAVSQKQKVTMTKNTNPNLNLNFVSLFVYHAVFKTMCGTLAYDSAASLGKAFYRVEKGEIEPYVGNVVASPLLCVLSALQHKRLRQPITNRASLNLALKAIRSEFSFANAADEPPDVRKQAKEFLKHNFCLAQKEGRVALDEALAGFPVSAGDLTTWEEHRLGIHE